MTNVIPFQPKVTMPTDESFEAAEPRRPFSFDMVQTEKKGFVLIDACVPSALAIEFMNLVEKYTALVPAPAA